jgi:16S rRNA (guanine(966)-N(2))-methyltransferase RsmD
MRVTGGEFRGRKLHPRGVGQSCRLGTLRPTSSKVREALFNILSEKIQNALFLDLYAGTGAVGMEAMSRGAREVYFVEADGRRSREITRLLEGCGCRAKAVIEHMKAEEFIERARARGLRFDIVFLDPPYLYDDYESLLGLLGSVLADGAVVIAEHVKRRKMPDKAGSLVMAKQYKYGDTMLTQYRKSDRQG